MALKPDPALKKTPAASKKPLKGKHYDISQNQITRQGQTNEGGNQPIDHHFDLGADSGSLNIMQNHIPHFVQSAETHFESNNITHAVSDLHRAVALLKNQTQLVQSSMDIAISRLTTVGGRATAPHPEALSLIRLRDTLQT